MNKLFGSFSLGKIFFWKVLKQKKKTQPHSRQSRSSLIPSQGCCNNIFSGSMWCRSIMHMFNSVKLAWQKFHLIAQSKTKEAVQEN